MRTIYATLLSPAFLIAVSAPLEAAVNTYTDRSAFEAATAGLTTINFANAIPPAYDHWNYSGANGMTINGVKFVGNLSGGGNFLYALTPGYYPNYAGWSGNPDVLQGPSGAGGTDSDSGFTHVILAAGTTAVGFGLYSVNQGSDPTAAGSFTLQLSTGDTLQFTTSDKPNVAFAGFTSSVPISSFNITGAPGDFPNLSNFSFGVAPEPELLWMIALAPWLLRRRAASRAVAVPLAEPMVRSASPFTSRGLTFVAIIAMTAAGLRAGIVVDYAHQWNQVGATGASGGPENLGFSLQGSNDFNVTNAAPVSYAGSSLSYTDLYGDAFLARTGPYSSVIADDYISGYASGSAGSASTPQSPNWGAGNAVGATASSGTLVTFHVDEPSLFITTEFHDSGGTETLYWTPSVGQSFKWSPGQSRTLWTQSGIEAPINGPGRSSFGTYGYSFHVNIIPYATISAGQEVSGTVLTGGGGTHQVTGTVASTGGGTLTGRFHTVPASGYSDPDQMLGASTPTFVLPSPQLLLWDVEYAPDVSSEAAQATLTFHFDPSKLNSGLDLSTLEMFHFAGGQWVPLASSVDPQADTITVSTNSFSPFALGVVPEPATLATVGLAALMACISRRRRS